MEKQLMIAINREFGSGGRIIGEELANRLQIQLIDECILKEVAKVMKVSESYIKKFDEKAPKLWGGVNQSYGMFQGMTLPYYQEAVTNNELYITQTAIIKQISTEKPSIFIGRCANDILKDMPSCVRIFLHADMTFRSKNITEVYGFKVCKNIEKEIKKVDKQRGEYYQMYTQNRWKDFSQYDLIIDTGKLGLQGSVELIMSYLKIRKLV